MDNELRAATSARGMIGDAIYAPEIGLPPLPE